MGLLSETNPIKVMMYFYYGRVGKWLMFLIYIFILFLLYQNNGCSCSHDPYIAASRSERICTYEGQEAAKPKLVNVPNIV